MREVIPAILNRESIPEAENGALIAAMFQVQLQDIDERSRHHVRYRLSEAAAVSALEAGEAFALETGDINLETLIEA